jgi:hypothetical protein
MFHDLLVFQNLVKSSEWSYLNERRAFSTCDKLNWTDGDVADMLCGLLPADHQKTVHDCVVNDLPGCELVTADQYMIFWHEETKTRRPSFEDGVLELSLKIAIFTDSDGQAAGLVTFHLSGGY